MSVLRIGSVATLSRHFQLLLIKPLLARSDVQIRLESGRLRELLHLGAHQLDVMLTSEAVPRDAAQGWHSTLIAQQPLAIVSAPPRWPWCRRWWFTTSSPCASWWSVVASRNCRSVSAPSPRSGAFRT